MDLNKLTQKAQEALQAAQTLGVRHGHQQIDGEHLFMALLEQENGLVPRIIEKCGAPLAQLRARLEQELDRLPRVSGGATEAGKVYVTQRLSKLIVKAGDEAEYLKD